MTPNSNPSDNLVETILLRRVINANTNYVNNLLDTIDDINRETSSALSRLRELNRISQLEDRQTISDILLYFYLPRTETRTNPRPEITPEITPEILERETSSYVFNTIESPKSTHCPISREQFTEEQTITMINHCEHIFNPSDLTRWFQSHTTCPVCRFNILNEENTDLESEVPNRQTETQPETQAETHIRNTIFNAIENIGNIATQSINRPIINSVSVGDILDVIRDDTSMANIISQFRS
jgi:hypothetical protein